MNYRTLGRTGIKVSEIGLGSEVFVNKEDTFAQEIINTAINAGINYFDLYNPEPYVRGFFGKAMKGRREKFVMQAHLCSAWIDGQYKRTRNMDEVKPAFADLLMEMPKKVVRKIPAKVDIAEEIKQAHRQLRVAAYCRVSTAQEEQLNSYDVQVRYYTEKIRSEPKWAFVGIFADRGLSGTSTKKRDEFNKMIKMCRRGKIDMIITKSISRFARNTADVLKYVRMLKEIGVDIFFEEQNIHSTQPGAEFYITIYGSIAQSESENISANVIWGKNQSAKEGKVPFHYKNFLGYRRSKDGKPEIDPEEAEIVKMIYERFLAGDSMRGIVDMLDNMGAPTPGGQGKWHRSTVCSILQNGSVKIGLNQKALNSKRAPV